MSTQLVSSTGPPRTRGSPGPSQRPRAYYLDRVLDEPANDFHPVVLFGRVMDSVERPVRETSSRRASPTPPSVRGSVSAPGCWSARRPSPPCSPWPATPSTAAPRKSVSPSRRVISKPARSLLHPSSGGTHPASTPSRWPGRRGVGGGERRRRRRRPGPLGCGGRGTRDSRLPRRRHSRLDRWAITPPATKSTAGQVLVSTTPATGSLLG